MQKRDVQDFISHWSSARASERANSQPFLLHWWGLLEVPRPNPHPAKGYFFEYPITEHHPDRPISNGRINLYRRAHVVLESKQFHKKMTEASQLELAAEEAGVLSRKRFSEPVRGRAWDDAIVKERGQPADAEEILEPLMTMGRARHQSGMFSP